MLIYFTKNNRPTTKSVCYYDENYKPMQLPLFSMISGDVVGFLLKSNSILSAQFI